MQKIGKPKSPTKTTPNKNTTTINKRGDKIKQRSIQIQQFSKLAWVLEFHEKMKKENRNVLLKIDNAEGHNISLELKNKLTNVEYLIDLDEKEKEYTPFTFQKLFIILLN